MNDATDDTDDLTKNQAAVLDVLRNAGRAMTAYDILDAVRAQGIRAPVQVYRALDRLIEMDLAHRIESLNAFVACAHDDEDHSHAAGGVAFAVCEDCGRVAELPLPNAVRSMGTAIAGSGFLTERTMVELRGHCGPCRGVDPVVEKILKP